jgi:hypothetical protein
VQPSPKKTSAGGLFREELVCFSKGISKSMKQKFGFVNIAGNAFNTITDDLIDREYDINVFAASDA